MKNIILLTALLVSTSCSTVSTAVVGNLIGPMLQKKEKPVINETRTVNETRNVQEVNIQMPKDEEPKTVLKNVPQIGLKESNVYFYAAPEATVEE